LLTGILSGSEAAEKLHIQKMSDDFRWQGLKPKVMLSQ